MILKNKNIKRLIAISLVVFALWVTIPKRFVYTFLNSNTKSSISVSKETNTETKNTGDYTIEKYNTPSYFNLFKFLTSFMPSKPQSGKAI